MQTPPTGEPAELVAVPTLALLMAELDPALAERLVTEHTADARGCCRTCSMPQGGPQHWPCTLYAAAVQAQRIGQLRRMPGQ